ncbi:threonine-phosphate decarboxylase CobD [Desulfuromonas sp.]|uniref:threonine-phosphate decarboxylase CobD n=1 Tax=Desulfuromonas sp. TaxID=892 RepID=UPI0025C567B7|nr:threonine-phosphate decarboxylase CobD [Desulfuromonas sp.]
MTDGQHGGGVLRAARELGRPVAELFDFSASINPLGTPVGALQAAREALDLAGHYPEIAAASLGAALAAHHRLPERCVLPGNGSTELLYLLPRVLRPRRALVVVPAFSEYGRSLHSAGTALDAFALRPEDDFRLDPEALLESLHPDTDLVLLANPANPTGVGIGPEVLEELARRLRGRALLAVDEAFVDFCPALSVIGRVPVLDNLWVFRSLTKFYALAGLRAGYLAGPAGGVARLAAAKEPWTLSTPALEAAKACLAENDFRRRTLEAIPPLRRALAEGLEELGMTVFAGQANYLLARLEERMPGAAEIAAALRPIGILIRDCANFPPLDGRYLRVAVRGERENLRLLEALTEVLK